MRTLLLCLALTYSVSAQQTARRSPLFTILRTAGGPLTLQQYRGKVVALAFIQTTCPHCQQLTTELNLIAPDYTKRGVQFLECAFNDDAVATLPEFVERYHPPFPVGYSMQAAVLSYLGHTMIDPRPVYVPHMVFLDRAGMIRADYPGESPFFKDAAANIRRELDRLLGTRRN